jgi:hypothetical protein
MRSKLGNGLPQRGNGLPHSENGAAIGLYEQAISAALRRALGGRRYAAKTLMRWTGASARTAKHWLAGSAAPSGAHLIRLMRASDIVFATVIRLVGRDSDAGADRISSRTPQFHRLRSPRGPLDTLSPMPFWAFAICCNLVAEYRRNTIDCSGSLPSSVPSQKFATIDSL